MECDGSICTAYEEDIPPSLYGSELVTNHPVVTNNNSFIQRSQISDPMFIPLGADNVQKKSYYCLWCDKYIQKFSRHIQTVHKDKNEIKAILNVNCPKERENLVSKLRNEHAFTHNYKLKDRGPFLVRRRPNKRLPITKYIADDYIPCDRCKVILLKTNLHRHYKLCKDLNLQSNRGRRVESRRMVALHNEYGSASLKDRILPFLIEGKLKQKILSDELVILYGNRLVEKYPSGVHEKHIRAKLRTIGRFLLAAEEIDPRVKNLACIAQPANIRVCVLATYAVCGANSELTDMRAPGTAKSIGILMKSVGEFLRRLYVSRNDQVNKKLTKDFLDLLIGEFEIINRHAETASRRRTRFKEVVLPSNKDITKLREYLNSIRDSCLNKLKEEFNFQDWKNLGETSLLLLLIFNRRRQGEVSKMEIISFRSRKFVNENDDSFKELPDSSKENARNYVRFIVSAKRDNDGTVILHKDFVYGLERFLELRDAAGVPSSNPFVFGLPPTSGGRQRYMEAYILIKKYSEQCGAAEPETLRGTTLRKQIATKCADDGIPAAEVEDLTRHLSHRTEVHRSHYRQPAFRDFVYLSQRLETVNRKTSESLQMPNDSLIPQHSFSILEPATSTLASIVKPVNQNLEIASLTPAEIYKPIAHTIDLCPQIQYSILEPVAQSATSTLSSHVEPVTQNLEIPSLTIADSNEPIAHTLDLSPQIYDSILEPVAQTSAPKRSSFEPQTAITRTTWTRTAWTVKEVNAMKNSFAKYIISKTYPPKTLIEACMQNNNKIFQNRSIRQIRAWLSNLYKRQVDSWAWLSNLYDRHVD